MTERLLVLGGSFDPIHWGHLRSALELVERLEFDTLLLMPCHTHAHDKRAVAAADHRLAMLELALSPYGGRLAVDDRELRRTGISYSVDSLDGIRAERGPDAIIGFVMGSDAWSSFHRWHEWSRILQLVNIVIMERADVAGLAKPEGSGEVPDALGQLEQRQAVDELADPAGGILRLGLAPQPYSSTQIRTLLASGRATDMQLDEMLPEPVLSYIRQHSLYQA